VKYLLSSPNQTLCTGDQVIIKKASLVVKQHNIISLKIYLKSEMIVYTKHSNYKELNWTQNYGLNICDRKIEWALSKLTDPLEKFFSFFTDFYSEETVNNQGLECLRFLNEVISDFDAVCMP
jgi:hypothetical protein